MFHHVSQLADIDTFISFSSTHHRRLEDKFTNHKIELRPWTLNINLDELHKNRELPGAFGCFLGVADSTLPLRGTAHRSVRGAPEAENQVNVFLGKSRTIFGLMSFPILVLGLGKNLQLSSTVSIIPVNPPGSAEASCGHGRP